MEKCKFKRKLFEIYPKINYNNKQDKIMSNSKILIIIEIL